MPRVPMMARLVINAPSQCVTSISSCPDSPGNRYLLPPENPTTSWGSTGPMMIVTSLSRTKRLMRTSTISLSIPFESSDTVSASSVPTSANVVSSHHAWFKTAKSDGPTILPIASSVMGSWVPKATTAVQRPDARTDGLGHRGEEQRQGTGPRGVGNDETQRTAVEVDLRHALNNEIGHVLRVQNALAVSDRVTHGRISRSPAPS